MNAKYIVRLDDACPTMNSEKWTRIENILTKYNIKPIVAVIPNNRDSEQVISSPNKNFWNKVRGWVDNDWHIAMHGYDHVYTTDNPGIVPFNKASEFAGVPYPVQAEKIRKSMEIFNREQINVNIWVAPAHSFDLNTLKALKHHTNISIISDDIALFPYSKYDFKWIPQQVWYFRKLPFGIWTGCFHPNTMLEKDFSRLESFLENNHKFFIDIESLHFKKYSLYNNIIKTLFFQFKRIRDAIRLQSI